MTPRLIVVAGVSSAGKSTFISVDLLPEFQTDGTEVLFGGKLVRGPGFDAASGRMDLGSSPVAILHYNLLLALVLDPALEQLDLSRDPLLSALRARGRIDHLYLCYAPEAVIRARVDQRDTVEPELAEETRAYAGERVHGQLDRVDQRQVVLDCAEALAPHSDRTNIVFSTQTHRDLLTLDDFRFGRPSERLEAALKGAA